MPTHWKYDWEHARSWQAGFAKYGNTLESNHCMRAGAGADPACFSSCSQCAVFTKPCLTASAAASRKTVFCVWAPLTLASANIESLKWYANAYRNNLYYSYLYLWSNGPNSWHPSPHDKSSRRRVRWRNFLIQMVTFIVLYILTFLLEKCGESVSFFSSAQSLWNVHLVAFLNLEDICIVLQSMIID